MKNLYSKISGNIMKISYVIVLIITGLLFQQCTKTEMAPEDNWSKIYDHSDFNRLFYSLDLKELTDNSFMILASTKMDTMVWPKPYILSTGSQGELLWSAESEDYISPVPNIISTNGEYYFFCMDIFLGTHVLKIDKTGSAPALHKSFPSLTYPLYASQTSEGKILLVSYDRLTRSTVLSCFDSGFSLIWSKEYNGIENYEEKVRLHLTRQGDYFPFFAGEGRSGASSYYFINGFYNFVFSMLYINPSSGSMTGVVNGIPYSAAASSLIQRNDTSFVLSRYDENQNYINTRASVSFTTISNITAAGGSSFPEMARNAVVKPVKANINGKDVIIISTVTRSNQVLLLFFNSETGDLETSRYFGSSYPVNMASVIPTNEGGLAVLTETYVAGRFSRVQMFKISPEKLVF